LWCRCQRRLTRPDKDLPVGVFVGAPEDKDEFFEPSNALSPFVRLTVGQRLRLAVRRNSGQGLGNTSAISTVWVAP
jgi:hypothetical protein